MAGGQTISTNVNLTARVDFDDNSRNLAAAHFGSEKSRRCMATRGLQSLKDILVTTLNNDEYQFSQRDTRTAIALNPRFLQPHKLGGHAVKNRSLGCYNCHEGTGADVDAAIKNLPGICSLQIEMCCPPKCQIEKQPVYRHTDPTLCNIVKVLQDGDCFRQTIELLQDTKKKVQDLFAIYDLKFVSYHNKTEWSSLCSGIVDCCFDIMFSTISLYNRAAHIPVPGKLANFVLHICRNPTK